MSPDTSIASKTRTNIFKGCCPYLFDEQNSVERLSSRTGTCLTCGFPASHLSWYRAGTRPSLSCHLLGKTRGTEESAVVVPPETRHGHWNHRGDIPMTSRVDLGNKFIFILIRDRSSRGSAVVRAVPGAQTPPEKWLLFSCCWHCCASGRSCPLLL